MLVSGAYTTTEAVPIRERKIKCRKLERENTKEAHKEYKKNRQNAKRIISSAKEKKLKECTNELKDCGCQNEIFRLPKQMVKEKHDISGSNCINGASGKVIVDDKGIRDSWKEFMKLMSEENGWDHRG